MITHSGGEWTTVKLGDCVSFHTGKLNSNAAKSEGKYPFFTCSQETLRTDTFSFDTECVLLAGNNANGVYPLKYFKGKFDAYQRTYIIRSVDSKRLANRFLYYALFPKLEHLQSISTGAATKFLTLTLLRDVTFNKPPIKVQERIAETLSAYDDLIENNTRRIKILEQMAQMLYREWFVKFRFPGHEKVKLVESELGLIPSIFEVVDLASQSTVLRGRSYKGDELSETGGLPFLNLKCIARDGGFRSDGLKRYTGPYKQSQVAMPGDIVMAVTDMTQERRIVARCGRVPSLPSDFGVFSMDLVKIQPNAELPRDYLYSFLRFSSFADAVKEHANGANVLHLSPVLIEQYKFGVAPSALRERFAEIVTPIYELADVLERRIANLRTTRDLLLPKLISGEISVEDLEEEALAETV